MTYEEAVRRLDIINYQLKEKEEKLNDLLAESKDVLAEGGFATIGEAIAYYENAKVASSREIDTLSEVIDKDLSELEEILENLSK